MSIGRLKKVGKLRYPTVRRSTDILQPESGDVDYSEALKDVDKEKARTIAETEDISQKLIKDNEEREKLKKKKRDAGVEENEENEEDDIHIDIRV